MTKRRKRPGSIAPGPARTTIRAEPILLKTAEMLRVLKIAEELQTADSVVRAAAGIILRSAESTPTVVSSPGRPEAMGPDLVSEDMAARSIPIRRKDAVNWLRAQGLSVEVAGRRVVVWDAVLARLRPAAPAPTRTPRKARGTAYAGSLGVAGTLPGVG